MIKYTNKTLWRNKRKNVNGRIWFYLTDFAAPQLTKYIKYFACTLRKNVVCAFANRLPEVFCNKNARHIAAGVFL